MKGSARLGPWVLFLVGGTALALVIHWGVPRRQVLVVDSGLVERLVKRDSDLRGTPPTDQDREATTRRLVDEEILLAEAQRRGHTRRGYVASRLLKKIRFLFTEQLTVPSDAEMRAVYDAAPERFRRPGSLAFEHVFLDANATRPPASPETILGRLARGETPDDFGDPHPLGRRVTLRTGVDLARHFGPDGVERLFEAPQGTWVGPIPSKGGTHYVRVEMRIEPSQMPFEDALGPLIGAWTMARQRDAIARRTAELVSGYQAFVEGTE